MRDESLPTVRDRYLESTRKDQGTGNYAREAEQVLSNWLGWCRERDPPVTATGDLGVGVLGEWAQSLKRRTHAGDNAGSTSHTYYAIVSACLSWAVKWEYLEGNPALKERANDELPEPSASEAVYRGGGFEAAQRVLRHADPSTTSAMYSHIEASELAVKATDAFDRVDES